MSQPPGSQPPGSETPARETPARRPPRRAPRSAPFLPPLDGPDDAWRAGFAWPAPLRLNIAEEACTRWARAMPGREALRIVAHEGPGERWTYGALEDASNRLANTLDGLGLMCGDRAAILLPQSAAVVITHLALYKLGAIAVPLANLFGPDAIGFRLDHSGARLLVTDRVGLAKLADRTAHPGLEMLVTVDDGDALRFGDLVARGADRPVMAATKPSDPALMIYTSGTTGPPKGALHGHRVVMGHLPGFAMSHGGLQGGLLKKLAGGLGRPGDRIWTPSDWAWAGGLLNVLLSAMTLGVPVVGGDVGRFDPERALRLVRAEGVRNLFLPPTALRMMKAAPSSAFADLPVRSVVSAGESLGEETAAWARRAFGSGGHAVEVNEVYGQTEANYVIASAAGQGRARAGAIGQGVPGHRVAILGPGGAEMPRGEPGEIAIAAPDPVMFLRYWRDEAATAGAFAHASPDADWSDAGALEGAWLRTGDRGVMDADGYVGFAGRMDDVITSAGYRIGPSEIEDCLMAHPAVALCAVIGVPDALRTEIVRAVIVPADGARLDEATVESIRDHARTRLSGHLVPREIVARGSLPLTTTGKVIRRALREEAALERGAISAGPRPPRPAGA